MSDNRAGWTLRIVVGVSWVLRTWMINRYVFNFFAPIFAWNVVYVAGKATVLEFVGCLIMVANSSTLPFSMLPLSSKQWPRAARKAAKDSAFESDFR